MAISCSPTIGEVKSAVQLYKSADKYADFSLTLTLVYKIGHMRGHFGVVFQAKSNGKVKSGVQLHKSADV